MSIEINARFDLEMARAAEREVVAHNRATVNALRRTVRGRSERVNNRRDCEQHPDVQPVGEPAGWSDGSLAGTLCAERVRRRRPMELPGRLDGPLVTVSTMCGKAVAWTARHGSSEPKVGMCLQHAGRWARSNAHERSVL